METLGSLRRTNYCGEVTLAMAGQEMTVCGSIARARDKGGIIFADLRDTTGILQLVFDEDTPKDVFAKAESLKSEYVVICRGKLRERAAKTDKIATGDVELYVSELRILSEAQTTPFELRDEINETTALAVWGDNGPVIVRWERPRRPITVNVVTGTTLGVLSSAAGRVFAAWLPNLTRPIVKREVETRRNLPPGVETLADADALLASVRDRGLAAISGNYMFRGVEAAAAPVFNFKNELTMALVIVGVEGSIDMGEQSAVLARLKGAADALSLRLGSTRDSDAAPPAA